MKICQLQLGMMVGVNYVIMSQGKRGLTIRIYVIMEHGNSAAIRNVEKCVRNPVINARNLVILNKAFRW